MLLYSEYWLSSSPACFSKSLRIILSFFLTSALGFPPMPRQMRYLLFLCFHSLMPLFIDSLVHSLTNICNSLSYTQLREHLVSQISSALLSIALINYYFNGLLVLGKRTLVVNSQEQEPCIIHVDTHNALCLGARNGIYNNLLGK